MGQESGKAAWPKPAGGYQTITGRRYGRRHAYVSFRPSTVKQWNESRENEHKWEGMELDSVSKDNGLCSNGIISDNELLPQSDVYDLTVETKREVCEPQKDSRFLPLNRRFFQCEANDFALPGATETLGNYSATRSTESSRWSLPSDHFKTDPKSKTGINLNIDSHHPGSSEGEDDDSAIHFSLQEEGRLSRRLDTILSELEKDVDYLSGLQSYLSAVIHDGNSQQIEQPCSVSLDNLSNTSPSVEQQYAELAENKKTLAIRSMEENGYVDIEVKKDSKPDKASMVFEDEGDVYCSKTEQPSSSEIGFCCKTEQASSSEMVVRPKVRSKKIESQSKQNLHPPDDVEYGYSVRQVATDIECCGSNCAFGNCRNSDSKVRSWESGSDGMKIDVNVNKQTTTQLQEESKNTSCENNFWEEIENDCLGFTDCNKDEESSSECSDGELSSIWTPDFALEQAQSSSDESWETLPGADELQTEIISTSSSLDDESFKHWFNAGEQTSLEEGEIPWVTYNEDSDGSSSSADEAEGLGPFVHSGLVILDGNNNLEDDSSMSEDLDMEWRLLDELGEGLAAQAISSVDPQLLTFMALEERLAQAMQAALAHLESLAIDGEQAPPPATKDTIEKLPQISVTEEQNGLEQSCAICCSEYVKEELVTELPCHHLFHGPCVTLWLQKSGTCPVCRHVLTSTLTETSTAAASTTAAFLSEPGSPPPRDGPAIR
uniref:RING-type E3 ubiquitin transferase n=1 Tax=Callorhinchus milii TaxID=7868 RepID=V9KCD3_CALMI